MPEETIKTEVNLTEYVCDKCGAGLMRFLAQWENGVGEKRFQHQCEDCGHIAELSRQYPVMARMREAVNG